MKKLSILLISVTTMLSFTECSSTSVDKLCSDSETRGKIISNLLSNQNYANQIMDSMKIGHATTVLSSLLVSSKANKTLQKEVVNKTISICNTDTVMCKMMMDKTMDMCDMDKSKCNMMMGLMQKHPNVKKSVQESMCGMKGM